MTRKIQLEIIGDNKAKAATDSAAKGFDKLGDAAEDAGDKMLGAAADAKALDAQLESTQRELKQLAAEIARTGDVSLFKKFRADSARLGLLTKVRRELDDVDTEVDRKSSGWFRRMSSGLGSAIGSAAAAAPGILGKALGSLPPQAQAGIAGGIAAAIVAGGSFIGAAAAAAILTGTGGAGLVGGIVLAAEDQRVKTAFGSLGGSIMTELTAASTDHFVVPLVNSAGKLRNAFFDIAPDLRAIFRDLSGVVGPLTDGLTGFARNAMPGIRDAVRASLPMFQVLAAELPRLGKDMREFFQSIADGGPGAAKALSVILKLIGTQIVGVGNLIEHASKGFNSFMHLLADGMGMLAKLPTPVLMAMGPLGQALGQNADKMKQWVSDMDAASGKAGQTSGSVDGLTGSVDNLTSSLEKANQKFEEAFTKQMGLDQANLAVAMGFTALTEGIKQNGTSLDEATAKGQANRQNILGIIGSLQQQREAAIAAGNGSVDAVRAANAAYDEGIKKIIDVGLKANMSRTELLKLVGPYYIDIITRRIEQLYIHDFRRQERRDEAGYRWGGITPIHAAKGLLSKASVFNGGSRPLYAFAEAETQQEAFVPRRGDRSRSLGILSQAAGWYGHMVVPALNRRSGYTSPVGMAPGAAGGWGGSSVRVMQPVQVVTPTGKVIADTLIEYAIDTGRNPASLFPDTQ